MIALLLGLALGAEIDTEFGLTGRIAYNFNTVGSNEGQLSTANALVGADFTASSKKNWLVGLAVSPNVELSTLSQLAGQLGWKSARLIGEQGTYNSYTRAEREAAELAGEALDTTRYRRTYATARIFPGVHYGVGMEAWQFRAASALEDETGTFRVYGMVFAFRLLEDAMSDTPLMAYSSSGNTRYGVGVDGDTLIGLGEQSLEPALLAARLEQDGFLGEDAYPTYVLGLSTHVRAVAILVVDGRNGSRFGIQVGGELHNTLSVPFQAVPIALSPLVGVRARL